MMITKVDAFGRDGTGRYVILLAELPDQLKARLRDGPGSQNQKNWIWEKPGYEDDRFGGGVRRRTAVWDRRR